MEHGRAAQRQTVDPPHDGGALDPQDAAHASAERFTGRSVLELRALRALARAERLTPEEQERLVALLEQRATELLAVRRSVPACDDLREIERLPPARGAALRAVRAAAERDAGDAWLAVGDVGRARAAVPGGPAAGAAAAGWTSA